MDGQRVHTKTDKDVNRLESAHPLSLIFNLLLLAGIAFFVYLVATIWAIGDDFHVPLNRFVLYAIVALAAPSFFTKHLATGFKNENARHIVSRLMITIISLGVFLYFQKQAWSQIISIEAGSQSLPDKVFLLIVGIHSIIVFGLALKLCYLVGHFSRTISNQLRSLLVFTNPFEEMRLYLINKAIVFVQVSWVLSYLLILAIAS